MILPFSTQINGKPTYFPEKILSGLKDLEITEEIRNFILSDYYHEEINILDLNPKMHTIRNDKNNRWKKGVMIDFFINCRQPNMFRFAPRIPVVSTQKVFMTYAFNDVIEISVSGKYITDVLQFAKNDGFDTWEDFFNYFYPKIINNPEECFSGKIIHWTDLRY